MPNSLEGQILKVLQGTATPAKPLTFADLSRRFGVSSSLVASCARGMIDSGMASPSMITVKGVQVLHGLMPQAAPEK